MAKYLRSKTKRKILLLLSAGLALGFTYHPSRQWWILKQIPRELENIKKNYVSKAIRELRKQQLIAFREKRNGCYKIILTPAGKRLSRRYHIGELTILKPKRWDGNWRMVIYDIPEKYRKARDILRDQLKLLGFYELQKSVWVYPFPCGDVVKFLIDMYEIEEYVHFVTIQHITNRKTLRKHFRI
ncbi:MAG: hypothetical protein A3C80_04550 [Candidatus Ryanbacteria bacterium RIFCSPHIGHO2_02_FULL_45_43]|uniref:Transcriptional repressor PaaX-like central Cas2-like domain-containing protein n=1 Tax=Candidatus Ryanbacteria bacterium RIFCSPHIGHO2_01_45_13 TaxID=1802112 RepID=A0A1G2G0N5_9BACT|nr:MAG: hypothetical protein A2718_04450 [Candidatus Ryanbacteria bacterium RIFCSPHIGHO2_01_FULL_44_130]OGZ43657.1 MAG: hypothetical protein A2W41_04940 [Candidatus Ryanbacteria bacterium RIFCSPHIGHO2_01_45_13]OGZ49141.1 MAG: hypothetical protein A3C80_04550 [Candidatus Ryanbacteria bacterium RIFCSPHIGHO2_02_FULL_45_43]OGZ50922.1 MAG: hypothetical protein A3E55_00620 [Candidatus Ryanbacteria bacterium RIFCSPHIGHO2_12_FULL_44_20]OGZ51401.1 MAG: hypothetical protein A3A17_00250 [Candidatus Ryanba